MFIYAMKTPFQIELLKYNPEKELKLQKLEGINFELGDGLCSISEN